MKPPWHRPTDANPGSPEATPAGAHEAGGEATDRLSVADLLAAIGTPEQPDADDVSHRAEPASDLPAPAQPVPQVEPEHLPAPPPHRSAEPLAVLATGLGLSTKAGPVFGAVELAVEPGTVAAIVGNAGSGRSCLLLTLAGRMAYTAGALAVGGSTDPKTIRSDSAVARISGLVELEGSLTVAESVAERCLIDGVRRADGRRRFVEAARLLELSVDHTARCDELAAPDRVRLAVALACVRAAHLVVLDDLDRDCSAADQLVLLQQLAELAAQGPAIVLSTVDEAQVLTAGLTAIRLSRNTDEPSVTAEQSAGARIAGE